MDAIFNFLKQTGFYMLFDNIQANWPTLIMLGISCVLLYLAIVKKFEPLLLLPIAFGMLLANLPLGGVMHPELFLGNSIDYGKVLKEAYVNLDNIKPTLNFTMKMELMSMTVRDLQHTI